MTIAPRTGAAAGVSNVPAANRRTGALIALVAVLVLSPDALIIRLIHETPWTILFWRGLLAAISLTLTITIATRGHATQLFRAIGWAGVIVAVFQACGSALFVTAVTHTSAANALVIIATSPLIAAVLSRIFLAEPIPRRTWIAVISVSGAVALLFSGSLQTNRLFGDFAALGGSLSTAAAITAIRRARAVNMVPAMAIGSLISCLIAAALGADVPQASEAGLIVLQGSILIPTAVGLVALAPRYISAPDASLIARLEVVLGPLWVWWILGEAPSGRALLSGIVIVTALTVHTALQLRPSRELLASSVPDQRAPSDQTLIP